MCVVEHAYAACVEVGGQLLESVLSLYLYESSRDGI